MSSKIFCAVYLLIAIGSVHSASYYYRAGREVIVPTLEEVKEVISEIKNEEPVVVEEIVALAPVVNVEPLVTSEEARAKQSPVLRLDSMEVIPKTGETSDKVQTVADTVRNAAVQAIEKQNEEVFTEVIKAEEPKEPVVDANVVVETPAVKSVPVVEPEIKLPEPVVAVVKEESVVPVVEAEIVVVKESVRSAEPEPIKPEEPVKDEKIETPKPTEKSVDAVVPPAIRQQAGTQNPFDQIQSAISSGLNSITSGFQNVVQNVISNTPFGNRPQQSDSPAETASEELNTAEVEPSPAPAAVADDATQAVAGSTASPNLLQSVQQAITQITNNIIPAQFRPTTAPSAAAAETPIIVSGTRDGEESVEVANHVNVVNDKIDLTKKAE